jgi:serine/threonine-protein kinase HipA
MFVRALLLQGLMMISNKLYVYLQRPDTGEWVTVGLYQCHPDRGTGTFRYAPSYVQAGFAWSIDPVNLPFLPDIEINAPRYRGLHDVLRDASPDAWGKMLIQKEHNLADNAHEATYLFHAKNGDGWGALAVGTNKKPSIARIATPKLPKLQELAEELIAIYERRPPKNATLRRKLVATPSLGGARPKAVVQDGDTYWLVKPMTPADVVDLPLLEHTTMCWGRHAGLQMAQTHYDRFKDGMSTLRIRRFDRNGARRVMAVSAASLLATEYPGNLMTSQWSYPRLAEELKRIGAPDEDRIELFNRMVFNAFVGNDDDHPRNHAVIYNVEEARWRLSPAFDVVPNTEEHPRSLTMQLSAGRFDISREAILADAIRFGFMSAEQASHHLDELIQKVVMAADLIVLDGDQTLQSLLQERIVYSQKLLS